MRAHRGASALPHLFRPARVDPLAACVAGEVIPSTCRVTGMWRSSHRVDAASPATTPFEPGGHPIVATPAGDHLRELAGLHPMRVHPRKRRLHRQLEPGFDLAGVQRIAWTLRLTARQAGAVVRMGPAAYHLTPAAEQRLSTLPDELPATAAVDLHVFRRSERLRRRQ